jgi:hypothetical protein
VLKSVAVVVPCDHPFRLGEAPVDPSWPGLSFLLPTPIGFLSDWPFAVAAQLTANPSREVLDRD